MMPMAVRRWSKRLAGALTVLIIAAAALTLWAQPVFAALLCPTCFGFERLSKAVYVERSMSDAERAQFSQAMAEGTKRVERFYGELTAAPVVLACVTDACAQRLGSGNSRGAAYLTMALRLAPLGLNPVIIAHERSHIELHRRLGLWKFITGAVPSWFDEGVAVVVSDDPRYLRPAVDGDRCLVKPRTPLPQTLAAWLRMAGQQHDLYAQAACKVVRWMRAHGGKPAVATLIDRVGGGATFDTVYAMPR
jgi:hypothetical protein